MAVISKGITLSYALGATDLANVSNWVELTNLQEIPELGGEAEALEITTLADAAHMYTNGIKNYGDSLAFKFLYEANQFNDLNMFTRDDEPPIAYQVKLPDGSTCVFFGKHSVKLDGIGVNAVLTYTLAIKPSSAMTWKVTTTTGA